MPNNIEIAERLHKIADLLAADAMRLQAWKVSKPIPGVIGSPFIHHTYCEAIITTGEGNIKLWWTENNEQPLIDLSVLDTETK